MRKRAVVISVILSIAALFFFSFALCAGDKNKKDDLYRQVSLLSDTIAIVETEYVDDVNSRELIYGALKGMLSSLDPHSQFLDPDAYNELKTETEGKFGGIGIEITLRDGLITIVTPIEDTPAWKAGIKAGDVIVKINGEITRDMELSDAVKRMRGKVGEAVNLTILRESEKKVIEFKIVRDTIKIKDIKEARILDDGIGYIRIVEFREDTPKEFKAVLSKLRESGMNALVLDLRNNPGGLLDVAVKVTSQFIEKDRIIVTTKSRKSTQDLEFKSDCAHPVVDLPIVVLINEGSASGSEILAGALQDYKKAIVLGKKSFGKGSVQTLIPLRDGSALRLTTSKYFTPLGREIHGKGVIPDIVLEQVDLQDKENTGKSEEAFKKLGEAGKEPAAKNESDYKTDNQLARAVDILKALRIYNKNEEKQ